MFVRLRFLIFFQDSTIGSALPAKMGMVAQQQARSPTFRGEPNPRVHIDSAEPVKKPSCICQTCICQTCIIFQRMGLARSLSRDCYDAVSHLTDLSCLMSYGALDTMALRQSLQRGTAVSLAAAPAVRVSPVDSLRLLLQIHPLFPGRFTR